MNENILFVDDEPAVLEGYKRVLRKEFQLRTATSGQEALAAVANSGPYAVVVSDLRMPNMDGVRFLSRISTVSPNTVRVMLTGQADLQDAIGAVNEGRIFRFLTKPCETGVLRKALTTCLVQYRLITAEKELLESTLMGTIKTNNPRDTVQSGTITQQVPCHTRVHVKGRLLLPGQLLPAIRRFDDFGGNLADALSLANPAAFSRAVRIRRYVQHLVAQLGLDNPWQYEVAAMLSQLGCITGNSASAQPFRTPRCRPV